MRVDFHTHREMPGSELALRSVPALDAVSGTGPFSLELHPWHAQSMIPEHFARDAFRKEVRAIGEVGLDHLRGASYQKDRFEEVLEIAVACGKPVVLHAVRATGDIEDARKRFPAVRDWILHAPDMNMNRLCERQKQGYFLSLGVRALQRADFDPSRLDPARYGLETDDGVRTIGEIYRLFLLRSDWTQAFAENIFERNFRELFG